MNLAEATQAPREIQVGGSTFKVRPLKAKEWGTLHAWLLDHAEDPFTRAVRQIARTRDAGAPLTQEQEDYLLSEGRQEARYWPPRAGTPAWFALVGGTEGGDVQMLLAILRPEQPGFTEDQAEALSERLTETESTLLMLAGLGVTPDPKGSAAGSEPTSTTTTKKKRPDPRKMTPSGGAVSTP